MKYIQKYVSTIVAMLFLALEVVLIKFYYDSVCIHCIVICLTILIFILFLALIFTKKDSNLLISFLVPLHNHSGNIAGIFMILFILVQVHLIGTELHEFICCHGNVWTIAIYIITLLFPFLIQSFFYSDGKGVISKHDRKVLILAVSNNSLDSLNNISNEYFKGKEYIDFIRMQSFSYKTLLKTLELYTCVDHIIFLVDKKAGAALEDYKKQASKKDFIEELLEVCFPGRFKTMSFEYIYFNDINNFTEMYKEVKPVIENRISDYKDRQVLFNISSGTALASAALALFSVIGERGFCYLEQLERSKDEQARILEFEINAFDLKELWNEILTIVRIRE
ncbi:MAG: hypothetical protein V9E90_03260 [Saprospiraceae bacterium]